MNNWLSEIDKKIASNYELWIKHGDNSFLHVDIDGAIEDGERMARVIRELADAPPLLSNIYTSLFMSEARNEGLPPQVQYWLQEIPKFLDNLSDDAKELIPKK